MKAYSEDLRKKVVEKVEGGEKAKEVSKYMGISLNAVYVWIRQYRKEGHVRKKELERKPRKISLKALEECIKERAEATLKEMAAYLGVSAEGVRKACKREKITLKKRHWSIGKKMRTKGKNILNR